MDKELNKDLLEWLYSIKEGIEKVEKSIKEEKKEKNNIESKSGSDGYAGNNIILDLIKEVNLDELLSSKGDEGTKEWNGKEWVTNSRTDESFKVISDKFLVGINSESSIRLGDDVRFYLEYLPCGEKIELFYNKKKSENSESSGFIMFNTDENTLYENEYLRTLFRKSEHWKVYPFIEYNSDGTIYKQRMTLDNFRLTMFYFFFDETDDRNEEVVIDLKDINFI